MSTPASQPTVTSAIAPVSLLLRRSDPAQFAKELGDSFKRYGFAVVRDHQLDTDILHAALSRTKDFFALPEAAKMQYQIAGGGGQRGYVPFGTEKAKGADKIDLKEFWHVGRSLPPGHPHADIMTPNLDVAEINGWNDATYAMFHALDALGLQILSSVATYLGLEEDWFADPIRDGNSILRLLHYPPQDAPPPEGSVRAAAHGDINVLTLLLGAEEGGLEVRDRNGDWLPINPPPDCIVINVGDMLERLTNHVLPSTLHRVVNPKPERARFARYSTPFFQHFRPDFLIRTLPQCVSAENPDRYPDPITAHEFLMQRLREINLV